MMVFIVFPIKDFLIAISFTYLYYTQGRKINAENNKKKMTSKEIISEFYSSDISNELMSKVKQKTDHFTSKEVFFSKKSTQE